MVAAGEARMRWKPDFRRVVGLVVLCGTMGVAASAPTPRIAIEDIGFLPAESFDIGDGLPAISVVAAAVTPQGQVWLGTMRGLVRYNSRRFVAEAGPNDVLTHAIGDLAATPDGRVWVSVPGHGVYMRERGLWHDVGQAMGLPEEAGRRLRSFEQRSGHRLFTTGHGTLHEWTGRTWKAHVLPEALRGIDIFDVLLRQGRNSDEDVMWLATFGKGLWRCVGRVPCEPMPMTEPGPRFNEVSSLESWIDPADGSTVLWVASYGGGLARLQHGQWQRILASDAGLPSNFLQRLLVQAPAGQPPHLWVGTRTGLAHRIGERWVPLDADARVHGGTVKALAASVSARGAPIVWIGSDQGATRLPQAGPWRTISQIGRRGNGVWSVLHEDRGGEEQLWVGSDGDGLMHYSAAGWRNYRIADGLPSDMVRSLVRDPASGELLVGTWGGHLSRFDGRRFSTVDTPWPKSDHEAISVMRVDEDGAIWFALREAGLARWKAGTWTRFGPDRGYPSRIYDLQRVGGTLWVSTNTRGLARIDAKGWTYFGRAEGLPDVSYYGLSLVPRADGRAVLWAGSLRAGVVRVDVTDPLRPTLVTTPALPVPPDPFVYDVVPDGRGNLFVSSNFGVSLWQPRAGGGYAATDYHRGDGLPHDESNYGALQVDGQRRIWLGTLGGVGVFTPPAVAPATPPSLVLETVSVDARAIPPERWTRPLELGMGSHDLQVEMALRTNEREAGIRYRSQMLGLEKVPTDWTADNIRNFPSLPPGDYRLRVEARDAAGLAAAPVELAVSIPLPFWRTQPALVTMCLAVALLLYVLLRLREGQQRSREHQLVGLVRQRTQELETRGLELRRINEELTRLSYHDPLTDLANRRMLLERLHGEWALAQARGSSLAFLLFDLDQFKAYNDQRGHLAGDDCLREIGRRIDAELPGEASIAGRYGGEEFGVVLPGMDLDQAMREAERIRHAVESANLLHPATPQGVVTISVGVAAIVPRAGFSAELLIAAADAALYRAKGLGKNRVEAAAIERD
jgi:diguanylate cyclase (GGDEF)-like protein